MSGGLNCFGVELDGLGAAIGSGDRRLLVRVLRTRQPDVDQYYEPDDYEDGPNFEQGMRRWIMGPVPPSPGLLDSLGEAVALMELVRCFGSPYGSLVHTSESGDEFRDTFLEGVAVSWLRPPFPMGFLLNRPLLGYLRDHPPFWGHLTRGELARVSPALLQLPPVGHYLEYVDEWCEDLAEILSRAVREGKDLVTFYG